MAYGIPIIWTHHNWHIHPITTIVTTMANSRMQETYLSISNHLATLNPARAPMNPWWRSYSHCEFTPNLEQTLSLTCWLAGSLLHESLCGGYLLPWCNRGGHTGSERHTLPSCPLFSTIPIRDRSASNSTQIGNAPLAYLICWHVSTYRMLNGHTSHRIASNGTKGYHVNAKCNQCSGWLQFEESLVIYWTMLLVCGRTHSAYYIQLKSPITEFSIQFKQHISDYFKRRT